MAAYSRNDLRKALELEQAIFDTLGEQDDSSRHATRARITALQVLLKHTPDDEVIDAAH